MQKKQESESVAAEVKNTKQDKTEAEKMWEEIKDKKIEMFALPNQVVSQYCSPVSVEPSKLFLLPNATAVLPSLEVALGDKYSVELVDRFLVVSRSKK